MKKLTTEEFISRSRMVHGDRYCYDKSIYTNRRTKITITCKDHGDFLQDTHSHMNGNGCVKCMGNNITKRQTLTTEEFIAKARQAHSDKYSYDIVEYKRFDVSVKIICHIHGIFEQTPVWHIQGCGCPICAGNKKSTTEEFIVKAKQVHDDRYCYDLVEYVNTSDKVKIVCPEHGAFEQTPNHHLKGHGCPSCAGVRKSTTQEFITKVKHIHSDRYDYSLVKYKNNKIKISIICSNHGVFKQRPDDHLKGHGCPYCSKSISRQELDLLDYIKSIYKGKIVTNTRKVIPPYELDIYLPDINLAFEYNGMYWHTEGLTKPVGYHQMKNDLCAHRGINLTHIWEQDWLDDNRFMREVIKRGIIYEQHHIPLPLPLLYPLDPTHHLHHPHLTLLS